MARQRRPDVRNLPEDPLLVASTSDTTPSIINVDCDRKLDKQLGEGSVSEADRSVACNCPVCFMRRLAY